MYRILTVFAMLALSACMDTTASNSFRDMSVTPESANLGPNDVLPYGEVAQACGVKQSTLGSPIAQFPESPAKYKIYDTNPSASGLRTIYVTGFADGCPRQFTASLVVFGSPETYEEIRYGPASKTVPITGIDQAYEQLKAEVCNVPAGTPCGASMTKMSKEAVFLTVYKNFGGSQGWMDMLIHGGKVIAIDHRRG